MRYGALALLTLSLAISFTTGRDKNTTITPSKRIQKLLEPIRAQHKLPALAAAVVNSKGLVAVGAVGVRKKGSDVAVTIHDQFHIGSDTKAMTAALIGRLIEEKKLRWDSALAQVFPRLAKEMPPEFAHITLSHLLSHRSGLPANITWILVPGKGVRQQRIEAIKLAFKQKLGKPGEKFVYSNLGYVLAGAMAENVADNTWEDLLARKIFQPLGIRSAGFGAAGTADKIDQPWPHSAGGNPVRPGPLADNPPVMGPAGGVHISLPDWSRFIADQLRGARAKGGILKPATYQKLRTSPAGDPFYALGGWLGNPKSKRGGGLVLTHDGSNTMNYAHAWLAPGRDFAVLVVANQGGEPGQKGCQEAADALIKQFLKK